MNWLEIDVYTSNKGIEPLTGCLMAMGINGFVIRDSADFEEFLSDKSVNWDYIDDDLMGLKDCETTVTVYLPENAQGVEMLEELKRTLVLLKGRDEENAFGRLEYELKNVKEEDWANNWKKYFKPIEIGDKLLVKPSWEPLGENESRTVLEIDPASSFGTGQHNTTRLCLEFIEENLGEGDRVLDLGCGSGILSIAAKLLGASECCAVDIDENSVKIATENAEKNHLPKNTYRTLCGNITENEALVREIDTGYDMVCANIVADVLISMSGLFGGFLKPDGKLILSGIIDNRKDEVIDVIKAQGFEVEQIKESEDWTAIRCKIVRR